MSPVSAIFLSGTVVLAGRWAEDKEITHKIVVGMVFSAIFLSAISQYDQKFSGQMATLILVGVLLRYGVPITKKMGLV